jgi:voltage-gated potassium channel
MALVASTRKRLYHALEHFDRNDPASVAISSIVVGVIAINLVAIILESIPSYAAAYGDIFFAIELLSCAFFLVEYLMRVWVCVEAPVPREGRDSSSLINRLRHVIKPMSIIDLVAFLPSILQFLMPGLDLRFLRILRLFRVFKLIRYFASLDILLNVLYDERKNLTGTFLIMLIVLTLAASALYVVERDVQPEAFGSIPQAMWWAMAALTTVGYGDAIPMTTLGKLLGSLVTILGIGMVALPSGILAASFSDQLRNSRRSLQASVDEALEDGILSQEEIERLRGMGNDMGLRQETLDELIQSTARLKAKEQHDPVILDIDGQTTQISAAPIDPASDSR